MISIVNLVPRALFPTSKAMAKRPGEVVVPLSRNVSVRTRVKEKEAIYERSRVNVTVERGSTFTFMISEFQACPSPPGICHLVGPGGGDLSENLCPGTIVNSSRNG